MRDPLQYQCTWNNGQKAVVHLVEDANGDRAIYKIYKPGFFGWMVREWFGIWYVSKRVDVTPKLIGFSPFRRELVLSYIPGQRVLEWVLERFGESSTDLDQFRNCEALEGDARITRAFERFRRSPSEEASRLRACIQRSYARLHAIGWQHGTSDPRNIIYDGHRAYIIDFDHARPSLSPEQYDNPALAYWFGISQDRRPKQSSAALKSIRS